MLQIYGSRTSGAYQDLHSLSQHWNLCFGFLVELKVPNNSDLNVNKKDISLLRSNKTLHMV